MSSTENKGFPDITHLLISLERLKNHRDAGYKKKQGNQEGEIFH